MKKIILALLVLTQFACGNQSEQTTTDNTAVAADTTLETYGEVITPDGAISPDELIAALEGKDSIEVKIVAEIEETCKKKGCWVTLKMGEGRDLMRVSFKDYGFFMPLDADGRTAIMQGKAFVKTTSVEQLRHFAEDAGQSEEEIAKITEPETSLSFLADGVILK